MVIDVHRMHVIAGYIIIKERIREGYLKAITSPYQEVNAVTSTDFEFTWSNMMYICALST